MKNLYTLTLFIFTVTWCCAQQTLSGRVLSATDQQPLPGASIKIIGGKQSTGTDINGFFKIEHPAATVILQVFFTGYQQKEITLRQPFTGSIDILLKPNEGLLKEVTVSTGYQQLAQERATGSFVQLDSTVLNRRVTTDIISRLEDVTSGLIFNKNVPGALNSLNIRGQSTLFANTQPLIVLDNFPYDGNLLDINPNDVESITVLKDAAAASIWGSRAGNGVIVITTKKGRFNQPVRITLNASTTVGNKPNLFYQSRMSSADFIGVEKQLFAQGFYTYTEQSPDNEPLDPAIETLIAQRDGKITAAQANQQLAAYAAHDDRNDFSKYFYQKSINQQYNLNVSGGAENQKYFVSAGYDKNQDNLVRNGYDRLTINANNTYSMLNHKLELTTGIYYTGSKTLQNNPGMNGIYGYQSNLLYPYASLADANSNPSVVTKDYRASFVQSAQQAGLLNWQYSPLQDLHDADNYTTVHDYRLNAGVKYLIIPGLNASVLYQYESSTAGADNLQGQDSYYTRNLINQYTQVNADGSLTRAIPLGAIFDQNNQVAISQDFRAQVNFDHIWNGKHQVAAIAGYEVKDVETTGDNYRLYGYDPDNVTSAKVDYVSYFNQYYYPGYSQQIPNVDAEQKLSDRFLSYYANAAYTYDQRIIISGSARLDQSNLFGVNTNQKGVPLWSAGLGWIASKENFYHLDWLPYLKGRLTYGYNGNVNKSLTAYTTAVYNNGSISVTNLPYAQITNPPNPELKWERDQIINIGADFGLKNNVISGTVEYYRKKGLDLTGVTPFPPSTGISSFYGNDASTSGHGIDVTINSKNFDRKFKWYTTLLLSHEQEEVTQYSQQQTAGNLLAFGYGGLPEPVVGRPLNAIYSYRWAGLDPQTGAPRGLLNGVVSENYAQIVSTATPASLVYNGPSRPTTFGSLRNTFVYGPVSISCIISYRLGYYFREPSVNYTNLLNGLVTTADYAQRWQQPGDELKTHVPSMPATIDVNRDNIYRYSSILVQNGDNVRLQDVNLSYDFRNLKIKGISQLTLYAYANNLGILWKANKVGLDPDYLTLKIPVTVSAGIKVEF